MHWSKWSSNHRKVFTIHHCMMFDSLIFCLKVSASWRCGKVIDWSEKIKYNRFWGHSVKYPSWLSSANFSLLFLLRDSLLAKSWKKQSPWDSSVALWPVGRARIVCNAPHPLPALALPIGPRVLPPGPTPMMGPLLDQKKILGEISIV